MEGDRCFTKGIRHIGLRLGVFHFLLHVKVKAGKRQIIEFWLEKSRTREFF